MFLSFCVDFVCILLMCCNTIRSRISGTLTCTLPMYGSCGDIPSERRLLLRMISRACGPPGIGFTRESLTAGSAVFFPMIYDRRPVLRDPGDRESRYSALGRYPSDGSRKSPNISQLPHDPRAPLPTDVERNHAMLSLPPGTGDCLVSFAIPFDPLRILIQPLERQHALL